MLNKDNTKVYFEKCSELKIPFDQALGVFFKHAGLKELGDKLLMEKKSVAFLPLLPWLLTAPTLAYGAYKGYTLTDQLSEQEKRLKNLESGTYGDIGALAGAGGGGYLGYKYGPELFKNIDPDTAKMLGGIAGGLGGGMLGNISGNLLSRA